MEMMIMRPVQQIQKFGRMNGEIVQEQEKKGKIRATWQTEKTKASRELCLEKIRQKFAFQRTKERKQKANGNSESKTKTQEKVKGSQEKTLVVNGNLYRNVTELQKIIKQSSKERLQLERQLAKSANVAQKLSPSDVTQCETLKRTNNVLRQQLQELTNTANDLQDAVVRLQERETELQKLKLELNQKQQLCADLEHRLHVTLKKQEETEKYSRSLKKQLQLLHPVNEECQRLQNSLEAVESRYSEAKFEVDFLQGKINNLEALVKHMREAADKRKELEKQHADAVAELQKKQDELRHFHHSSRTEKQHAQEAIQTLESKVRELQKKCDLQNVLHEELALEMATLRRSQVKQQWRSNRSHSADMPSEPSRLDQEMDMYLVGSDTIFSSNKSNFLSSSLSALDHTTTRNLNVSFEPFNSAQITSPGTNMMMSPCTTISSSSPVSCNVLNSTSYEIDRILARIEQDNRVLAELEKSRATVGSPVSSANIERLRAQFEEDQKKLQEISHKSNMKTPVSIKELDVLMAKLEQDNKILAELDRKRATISNRRPFSTTPPGSRSSTPLTGTSSVAAHHTSLAPHSGNYSTTLPALPSSAPYSSSGSTANRRREDSLGETDHIELPHRGHCKVFISRYNYDPLKQSPNENPEAELRLIAGDYILIFGDMDEDGFFSGELLDGRKGLVPSNFVEKLTGEELYEFQSQVLYCTRDSDDGSASMTCPDGDFSGDDPHVFCRDSKMAMEDFHRMNDYIDLEDIEELDEDDISVLEREPVPPPTRLVLERQLNKSILIGWLPPDAPRGTAEAYHVYVDGVPKATIRASEKTRSLVEGVDCNQPHRISVRSVNPAGRHSRDAACTIIIGKDIPLAPTCVKASNVTSTSSVISWLPSNSNFQHVVAINSVEVKTLKPSIFRHNISGLAPNTTYRVSVRARPARLFFNHENPRKIGMLTSAIEFKTLPKGCTGLPEPPVDVQVEPGPQDGTLLVTWLPVTINTKGTSNGAPVTGYAVYAGDRKISEIDSPTGDHALLDMMNLAPLRKRAVTVKTKSGENLSIDSMPCIIPVELLKNVAATMIQAEAAAAREEGERPPRERKKSTGSSDSESDTELAELFHHVARKAAEFDPNSSESTADGPQGARVEELVEEGIRSELSDIAEEPEDDLAHNIERNERRSQHARDNKSRDYDRHGDRIRKDDRSSGRRDDRGMDRRDDRAMDRRDDRMTDRRDDDRRDRRDDRYDDRRRDERRDRRDDRTDDRRDPYPHDRRDQDATRTTKYSQPHPDPRAHERRHGRVSPPGMHRGDRDRPFTGRPMTDQRRLNNLDVVERRNSAGQVIIEPEENLSDKEIYPQTQHVIPAIEITRDSELASQDDYLRGNRRGNYTEPHKSGNPTSHYYPNERSRTHAVSPTTPGRYNRDQENSYYGHRAPARTSRVDDYRGNGYRTRGSHRTGGERPRLFIAVYDYDPHTMSSNPATADEELSFQEGQIIKVYGEKDIDGYLRGEIEGRIGYVPYSMVSEIPMDEEETGRHLMNESSHHHHSDPSDPWSSLPVKKLIALYDYDPQELSPNVDAEMELAFRTGDLIYVYGGADEDGFYMGELNGARGLVPSNFLTEAPGEFRDSRMVPSTRSGRDSYSKDHHDRDHHDRDPQYMRGSGGQYSSAGPPKEHLSTDPRRHSEREATDRLNYDRHASERDRNQYNSTGRSGQHW